MAETNLIKAIINIVNNPITDVVSQTKSHTRANNMGDALEEYIKDIFANTVCENDVNKRNKAFSQAFSYLGNQNNPPDAMIRGGDAIEVKKIESASSALALNSSYPKAKLYSNSPMITKACKNCESWTEKDILYVVGVCKNNMLSNLTMVYGIDYAASAEIYEKMRLRIIEGVNSTSGINFTETKELGHVNHVDPLGITYFRIRGMWGIENPLKVFDYIYKPQKAVKFNFMTLIGNQKYGSFASDAVELEKLALSNQALNIQDVKIRVPDNPARQRCAKMITYYC